MSEEKPLRYEDQQALIETNKRLMRENEQLKTSKMVKVKVKKQKKPWKYKEFVRNIFLNYEGGLKVGWCLPMFLGVAAMAIGSTVFVGNRYDDMNAKEHRAPVSCYAVKSYDGVELSNNDWEGDVYLYSVRAGRNNNWEKRIDSPKFFNKQAATEFLSANNLKACK